MKSDRLTKVDGWWRFLFFATMFASFAAAPCGSGAQGIDPNLRLGIRRTNQNVVLNWFGSNTVSYQLESGSSLTSWVNSGSVITGKGGLLFVTNVSGGSSRGDR